MFKKQLVFQTQEGKKQKLHFTNANTKDEKVQVLYHNNTSRLP